MDVVAKIEIWSEADGEFDFAFSIVEFLLMTETERETRMGVTVIWLLGQDHTEFTFGNIIEPSAQRSPRTLLVRTHRLSKYFNTSS